MGAGLSTGGIATGMSDWQEQLADLRRRVASIDRKYAKPRIARPQPPAPKPELLDDDLPWQEVETAHGRHWETERLYERHRRHGSIGIADLEQLPHDLLLPISNGEISSVAPAK